MPNNETHTSPSGECVPDRETAAEVRVKAALACIEEAQRLLDRAGQAVCSVNGLTVEWRRLGTLHDQVKRAWYAVNDKSACLRHQRSLTLAHEPNANEEEWQPLSVERRS